MEQITLSYHHPAGIDGEPVDVAGTVITELGELAPRLRELFDAAYRQIRNAELDAIYAASNDRDPRANLRLVAWEGTPDGRRAAMLKTLGDSLPGLALELEKAHVERRKAIAIDTKDQRAA